MAQKPEVLTLIAERPKQSVMSWYCSEISAALCYANEMSQKKFQEVLVLKGLFS